MPKRDFYDVLGVPRGASDEQIKKAYKQKARTLHPDSATDNPDAESQFKEVNEAYSTLNNPKKRKIYDHLGHDAFSSGAGAQGFSGADFSQFTDVFDSFFGDIMGKSRNSGRGSDLRYNLNVSLEEAFFGAEKTIEVTAGALCSDCNGRGTATGMAPTTCSVCGGSGRVRQSRGMFMFESSCGACGGKGTLINNPCHACSGSGRVTKTQRINVSIPPGIETDNRIRISGRGEAGTQTGMHGDLYVFITVENHPVFARNNSDLYCQVPVSMVTAALGGQIDIPNIDGGRSMVRIDAGSQSGKRLRLSGKGMPILRKSGIRGNLYVDIHVETPVNLTQGQKELLRKFDEAGSSSNNPRSVSFKDKLKGFWGPSQKS
ncbi:MAG: molecular chaperone DnaJ [Rhodobacteraceae bacterium]|nr:molecular chaperone DnaJ [Paracoccaceae bacterium]